MSKRRFKGLYLQATGDPCCFSFVTYTPQTREQMLACGDLDESEEYFNPVIFDFLLFASEAALGAPAGNPFPITYDDVSIITSRQRGSGIQHEYLIRLSDHDWNDAKQLAVDQLQDVVNECAMEWSSAYRLARLKQHQTAEGQPSLLACRLQQLFP